MRSSDRLRKSRNNRMIFGVAGGMAEYFDVDPVLMRVIFVLVGLVSAGTAIIAYILLAIIMPGDEDDSDIDEEDSQRITPREARNRRSLLALILVLAGALALIANFGILSWWNWGIFWPVVLIALGLALILSRVRRA